MKAYKKISKKKQKQYSEWFRKARKYYVSSLVGNGSAPTEETW